MNFDFLYHSYTFTITVFAAVFGMAYPLILQAIDRIDDKYTSSVLATDLRKRWQFKTFNRLIVACIVCVAVLAYVLEYVDDEWLKYAIVSASVLVIVTLMIVVVLLFHQILNYYTPVDLLELLEKKKINRNANALLDLAKYAAKTDDFELHLKSLSAIAVLFYGEQRKAPEDKPVEYSAELYDILAKISKSIGDTSMSDDRYNYIGIASVVYAFDCKGGISMKTYQRMWEMVNWAAKAGNGGWFKDYWTYADQYYRFYKLEGNTELAKANLREFYQYHVMMGGLLVYFKRYDWLSHIMHFSQSEPPRFELIPGTLGRIFEMVALVDELRAKPFGLYQKYQFIGLERGAKMDDAIASFVNQYLALLIIRLWTYNDYNINYANPLDMPQANDEYIEANESLMANVERMKRCVVKWYQTGLLSDFGLYNLPEQQVVQDKLDEYIEVLKQKIIEIQAREEVDKHKAQVIKDEIIVTNANSHCLVPIKDDNNVLDEGLYNVYSTPVMAIERIDKPFITIGSKKELGNFGACLVHSLNVNLLNVYLVNAFPKPCTAEYNINQKNLLDAIDKLNLPDDYVIIETGNALNLYELKNRITVEDNRRSYAGHAILDLGMSGFDACVLLMRSDDIPFIEIVETDTQNSDCQLIDKSNCLYCNIDSLKPPYDVRLVQSIKLYTKKALGNNCLLKVMYDYGGNKYDLDKVTELCPKKEELEVKEDQEEKETGDR